MAAPIPTELAAVLHDPLLVRQVSSGIWSLGAAAAEGTAQYDSIGSAYDFVAGLDLYHRLFWGVSTRAYRDFADQASLKGAQGNLLDAGCGSMLFSAHAYRVSPCATILGTDVSLEMLKRARTRLGGNRQLYQVVLLWADFLNNPFRQGVFDVVVCLHVAHVLEDLDKLLFEIRRVLKPGGWLYLTSVVLVNGWRDRYLHNLSRRGIMATPRTAEDVLDAHGRAFGVRPEHESAGSMLFVRTHFSPARQQSL